MQCRKVRWYDSEKGASPLLAVEVAVEVHGKNTFCSPLEKDANIEENEG